MFAVLRAFGSSCGGGGGVGWVWGVFSSTAATARMECKATPAHFGMMCCSVRVVHFIERVYQMTYSQFLRARERLTAAVGGGGGGGVENC